MNPPELRPLSLGEILDRTFTMYRGNFLLFVALAGIPRIPTLAVSMFNLNASLSGAMTFTSIGLTVLTYILLLVAYLFSQGSSTLAVSELYLGRSAGVAEMFRRVISYLGSLLGSVILSTLLVGAGFLFLIAPGVYLLCRVLVCVPAVVIEKKGPVESISRSFSLTSEFAGRAFVILALYFALAMGFGTIASAPAVMAVLAGGGNLAAAQGWLMLQMVLSTVLTVLLTPVLLIASSIYYYDLRVRKEAFDLQVMMDPEGANLPPANLRSILPEGQ